MSTPSLPSFESFVLCTHNQGKLTEMTSLLQELPVKVLSPNDFPGMPEPVEDRDSFLGNARIKTRSSYRFTGLPSMGDDSGLVVPALDGAPGVHSARYAGVSGPDKDAANRRKLREAIRALPETQRQAHFHCTIVFQWDETNDIAFTGRCEGLLIDDERGEGGFGYDPMFYLPALDKTFAEISKTQKNELSHRGKALQQFLSWLRPTIKN